MNDLAGAISRAIRNHSVIDPAPYLGLQLSEAFLVQKHVFDQFGRNILGSKLALKDGLCHSAPLLFVSDQDHQSFESGMAIEVELAFVLKDEIPIGAADIDREQVTNAIGSVHIGVELLRSRYYGGARGDPSLAAADLMSNIGYVLGPELDSAVLGENVSIGPLSITQNERLLFDKIATHADVDPLKAVVALANQTPLATYPILEPGQVITTGTLCSLIPVEPGEIAIRMRGQKFLLNLN